MRIKKQEDIKDCGISILQAFHNYFYNRWININIFKKKALYGLKGINVEGMCELARVFGMKLSPMKGNIEALKDLKLSKPIIALIGNEEENHYVIIEKIRKRHLKITDPMTGQTEWIPFKKFQFQFLDIIIYVEKIGYSHKHVKVNSIFEYLTQFKTLIPLLLISTLISILVLFSSSFFMKIIMDQVIPGALNKTLIVLFVGFVTMSVLGALNNGFKNFVIYKMSLQISMEITNKFNNKVKNVKLMELQKLTRTDLMRRAAFIEPISLFISSTVFSISSEVLMCLISSVVLIWINVKLFLISAIVMSLLLISTLISQTILNKKYGKYIKSQIENATINLDSLGMSKQLKNPSLKTFFLIKQSECLYNFKKIDKKIWIINNIYEVIETIITSISPLVIVVIATNYVIESKLSIGSLILYISMFHFFVNPTTSIANVVVKFPLIKKEMDMLQYVLDFKEEKINLKGKQIKEIKNIKLSNISFGFETGKTLLKIKQFEINKHIRLKGENGSGKTTFLDIISTNYNIPGVYYNNLETKYYNLNQLRESIFRIDPSDYLPSVKVIEYLTNNNAKQYKVFLENYQTFHLDEIIKKMNISLDKKMINNASNFSSGQRQMIQLLKLFTKEYKIIMLDEAFDNIEKENCEKVISSISDLHKNALFIEISHNNIFVKKGKEVNVESFKQN
ncbi:Mbov_0121 family peptidase domain-containing ABC transporter [Mycoplasma todarodis]|uniref:ABC transmembrane type-1 domain-containing protein n=1 Tax=Mycoplasma todarodis TaxID=1937191 RepID=A0A4R0XN00_9MOLU|nr:cysteine peptidase family C39 domain-containing protein [Mycoplasma todarodis]TCG10852.1 hypothetical protein C4B25_02860 [Mycoplasma todarodis]